jgi:hypothetical protein
VTNLKAYIRALLCVIIRSIVSLKSDDIVKMDVRLLRGDWIKNCVCISSLCRNLQHAHMTKHKIFKVFCLLT